jgi:hypothetical protein
VPGSTGGESELFFFHLTPPGKHERNACLHPAPRRLHTFSQKDIFASSGQLYNMCVRFVYNFLSLPSSGTQNNRDMLRVGGAGHICIISSAESKRAGGSIVMRE